jgi:hypothetical protein
MCWIGLPATGAAVGGADGNGLGTPVLLPPQPLIAAEHKKASRHPYNRCFIASTMKLRF